VSGAHVAVTPDADGQVLRLVSPPALVASPLGWAAALAEALHGGAAPAVRAVVVAGFPDGPGDAARPVVAALGRVRVPVVALVRGHLAGAGLAAAVACDLRIAADTATVAYGEACCAAALARLLGEAAARDVALTGRTLAAHDARRIGLFTRVVPAGALDEEGWATAAVIAGRAPLAVQAVKALVRESVALAPREAIAREHAAFGRLIGTHDHKAAVEAFLARARPAFRGA
jgi:2-(1,2-epoxy-1,2-dihydrophenyl)acetyl-CoA isomerase